MVVIIYISLYANDYTYRFIIYMGVIVHIDLYGSDYTH